MQVVSLHRVHSCDATNAICSARRCIDTVPADVRVLTKHGLNNVVELDVPVAFDVSAHRPLKVSAWGQCLAPIRHSPVTRRDLVHHVCDELVATLGPAAVGRCTLSLFHYDRARRAVFATVDT